MKRELQTQMIQTKDDLRRLCILVRGEKNLRPKVDRNRVNQ